MNIDEKMSDWRERFFGQARPEDLKKIRSNIVDLSALLRPEDSLLDVGCNIGSLYEKLNHANYEGIDIDPATIARAKERFPGVNFRCMDLFDLEGKWDVVFASRVLPHLPFAETIKKLLECTNRLCVVLVVVVARGETDQMVLENGARYERPDSYFRTFSEETLYSAGDCRIIRGGVESEDGRRRYSTVIYER